MVQRQAIGMMDASTKPMENFNISLKTGQTLFQNKVED